MSILKSYLEKISEGEDLSRHEAGEALESIISEDVSGTEIGALLFGLRIKGESIDEIAGFVDTMEKHMVRVELDNADAIDVCGTGGDQTHSFNVSTTAGFIAAAAGATVAKHGNKSVSSKCGSADVLDAMGIRIDLNAEQTKRCADEIGICFFFAPLYHPAMKVVVPHRKNLGLRTVFNMLGPLLNPARVSRQLIGVFDLDTARKLAGALKTRGSTMACTVHSKDGFDELSPFAENHIIETSLGSPNLKEFSYFHKTVIPSSIADVAGQDPKTNAGLTMAILSGEKNANREMALLNAGFAIYVAGLTGSPEDGIRQAEDAVDSGAAMKKMEALKEMSNSFR